MREDSPDGVVENPWDRPPGADEPPAPHRRGDWGGEPVPAPEAAADTGPVTSPARRVRPARIAVLAVTALAGVETLTTAWALWETRSVAGDEPGGGGTPVDGLSVGQAAIDRLNAAVGVDAIVTFVGLAALIVSAVFVIRWQNVVLRNQRGLGIFRPRYSPVAAGFSWFVPFWSLFGPKRALNDAWRAAEPVSEQIAGGLWLARAVPGLFAAWWTAWLVAQVLGNVMSRITDDTLSGQTVFYVGSLVATVSTIVAGVLFVGVMERITERHDARIAERAAAASAVAVGPPDDRGAVVAGA